MEQKSLPSQTMTRQCKSSTFTAVEEVVTFEESFEMEVYHAMDEFMIDYSVARYAVAEKAVVTAIANLGAKERHAQIS